MCANKPLTKGSLEYVNTVKTTNAILFTLMKQKKITE